MCTLLWGACLCMHLTSLRVQWAESPAWFSRTPYPNQIETIWFWGSCGVGWWTLSFSWSLNTPEVELLPYLNQHQPFPSSPIPASSSELPEKSVLCPGHNYFLSEAYISPNFSHSLNWIWGSSGNPADSQIISGLWKSDCDKLEPVHSLSLTHLQLNNICLADVLQGGPDTWEISDKNGLCSELLSCFVI